MKGFPKSGSGKSEGDNVKRTPATPKVVKGGDLRVKKG